MAARNLVTIQLHASEQDVVLITLTLEGFDLGRRYRSWWDMTGLWFKHYRDHWVWFIVAAIGGGVVPKVIDAITIFVGSKH